MKDYCRTRTRKEGKPVCHKEKNGKCEFCDTVILKKFPEVKLQSKVKEVVDRF